MTAVRLINLTSPAARAALIYITVGTLILIWSGVWFVYLRNNPPESDNVFYLCGGCLVSGFALLGIGLGVGTIGRNARHADLPATDAVPVPPNTVGGSHGQPSVAAGVPSAIPVVAPAIQPVAVSPVRPVNATVRMEPAAR